MVTTLGRGVRERLPLRRRAVNYELVIATKHGRLKLHLGLGLYEDGRVGELFLDSATAKLGSTLRVALSTWAVAVSKSLQYGMPLSEVIHTFRGIKSEEGGAVECGANASSPWDAIAQLLEAETDAAGRLRAPGES